jgi:hypothetical protein
LAVIFSEEFVWRIINARNFEKKMSRLEQLVKKFEEHNIGVVPAYTEDESGETEPPSEKLPEELSRRMEQAMFL